MKIKGQNVTLDHIDWQILRLLQGNAKLTYTEIGNKLDLAHSTVYDRIQRMEQHRVIKKYEAIIDPEKIGMQRIIALITVTVDPKETESIAKKLAGLNDVIDVCTSFSEELVVTAKVIAKDQVDLHSFVAKSIAPLPGVLRIRTGIVTKKYKEERFHASP